MARRLESEDLHRALSVFPFTSNHEAFHMNNNETNSPSNETIEALTNLRKAVEQDKLYETSSTAANVQEAQKRLAGITGFEGERLQAFINLHGRDLGESS